MNSPASRPKKKSYAAGIAARGERWYTRPMSDALAECRLCGLVQRPGPLEPGEAAVRRRKALSVARTRALSLTGLLFYVPANYFPLVTVDYHGLMSNVTLWSSVRSLFDAGQYAVGALV